MKSQRIISIVIIFLVVATAFSVSKTKENKTQGAKEQLEEARLMLKGPNKKLEEAENLLRSLADEKPSSLGQVDLCYVFVYLGYIQDISGNHELALPWYRLACELDGPNISGIRQLAQTGVTRPITWIRHLDEGTEPVKQETKKNDPNIIERIGRGLVLRNEPQNVLPQMNLSKEERLENFDILSESIDKYFSFFDHKEIDWQPIVAGYRSEVENSRTTKEYYLLIYKLVRELKDAHSWLCNYKDFPSLGGFSPAISTRMIEKKLVVTDITDGLEAYQRDLCRGSVIVAIDQVTVKGKINRISPLMPMYSSERCFLENAYRRVLKGEKNTTVRIKYIPYGEKQIKTANLKRVTTKREEIIQPDFDVNKGKFIWYGIHPSGIGYIRIVSFEGRMEIADEFDSALESLKNTPALIIDVRENPGGYGTAQARIIGRLIKAKTKGSIVYQRNGSGHKDFSKRDKYLEPTGNWQYTKPIALLINSITGSASDLFVCRMISAGRPITIGSDTHGNSTGVCVYVQLPCNIVARISNGYICDASGRIIEGNGNIAQIHVEPTIADILKGIDPVIERAIKELKLKSGMVNL